MRILYIGASGQSTNSLLRANALRRLGHSVEHRDPSKLLPSSRYINILLYKTGYRFTQRKIEHYVAQGVARGDYDLAWIDAHDLVGRAGVEKLKKLCNRVVGYVSDDPTGGRDKRRWGTFFGALTQYDLLVVPRVVTANDFRILGAKAVFRVNFAYDPVAHARVETTAAERTKWSSEVVFVGTWMPERGPILARLVELGVPLAIHGDRWHKAPEFAVLRSAIKGPGVFCRDYVMAIQEAKIALGLVSKGNRDLHTTRSAEIPFIGPLFCAERTSEHMAFYRDGDEAVFWTTPEECAERIEELLSEPARRLRVAKAGRNRVIANKLSNDEILRSIIDKMPPE